MRTLSHTAVRATVQNGIEVVDVVDFPDADFDYYANFFDQLDTLDNDEEIFCLVDPDQFDELESEYGIN